MSKYKFDTIFPVLGYIKELLKEFNLPKYSVATDDTIFYKNKLYIRDLGIYRYNGSNLVNEADYYFNRPMLNMTTNMDITTSYYSTDMHEYLGNYLRFIRDYTGLNLMSLYNCFSNRVIYPINYDEHYTYYAIPVKFNQIYTIGLDSSVPVEMYCCLWDTVSITNLGDKIWSISSSDSEMSLTYSEYLRNETKVICNNCIINKPFIYDKLKYFDATKFLSQEDNVKLVIKLPITNKTSITVLEGDYSFNTVVDNNLTTTGYFGDEDISGRKYLINYPTKLSLFRTNDENKHPFADRLVEYLLDTAITHLDELDDNIKRTQEYLRYLRSASPKILYGVWDPSMNKEIYNLAKDSVLENNVRYIKIKSNDYLTGLNGEFNAGKAKNLIDIKDDLLMYVDKDVESMFLASNRDENII